MFEASGVRIHVIQLVEKNIRHRIVPPVASTAGDRMVQIDILFRSIVEILLTHEDPVEAILITLVDTHQACADDSC